MKEMKDKRNGYWKRNVASLLSCVLYLVSIAQTPSFVNVNASKLYFDKDSSQFMGFYKKIPAVALPGSQLPGLPAL